MKLLPALSLLLLAACSHAPTPPLPPGGQVFRESEYAADVRARILRRNGDVYTCYQEAAAAHPLRSHEASGTLGYNGKLKRFAFEGPPEKPDPTVAPPTPFRAAFEQCLAPRIDAWMLPVNPSGDGIGARFHFLPPGAPLPPAPDLAKLKLNFGEQPGMDPEWSSALFDEAGARGFVDLAEMTRPRRISGRQIMYTQEAIEQRVEGVMIVRCIITREGTVRDCTVLQTLPALERAALDSLATMRYTPVTYRGKPLEVTYTFTLVFKFPRG